jgi:positive regulator of sigma E activity
MIRTEDPIHPDDLMKTDLLSEILLVGSGLVLFVPLLLILVSALTQSLALR